MSSTVQPNLNNAPVEDPAHASELTYGYGSSTSDMRDQSDNDSMDYSHPDILQDCQNEMDILYSDHEPNQPADSSGPHATCAAHLEHIRELMEDVNAMKAAVKDAETKVWAYEVRIESMEQEIFTLKATLDNMQDERINNLTLTARNADLVARLGKMTESNHALRAFATSLKQTRDALVRNVRNVQAELREETNMRTHFQHLGHEGLFASGGNVERFLAEHKIRKMREVVAAARAETAHWKLVAADIVNGHRPPGRFPSFPTAARDLPRRRSF